MKKHDNTSGLLASNAVATLASLCLIVAGCGGGVAKKEVFPVSGKLLIDGKPFGPATIALQLDPPEDGAPSPSGNVDENGNFQLSSYESGDGAPQGKYKVILSEDVMVGKGVPAVKPITIEITSGNSDLEINMTSIKGKTLQAGPGIEEDDQPKGPGGI